MLSLGSRICVHLDYEDKLAEGKSKTTAMNEVRKLWSLTHEEMLQIVEEQEQFLEDDNIGELVWV